MLQLFSLNERSGVNSGASANELLSLASIPSRIPCQTRIRSDEAYRYADDTLRNLMKDLPPARLLWFFGEDIMANDRSRTHQIRGDIPSEAADTLRNRFATSPTALNSDLL